jgi:hypothetical protein
MFEWKLKKGDYSKCLYVQPEVESPPCLAPDFVRSMPVALKQAA